MNRTPKPTSSSSNKKQVKKQQQPQTTVVEQPSEIQSTSAVQSNVNPEKMQQIQDKMQELEHLLKIKDMSGQMANYFDELAKSVEGLAGGAQGNESNQHFATGPCFLLLIINLQYFHHSCL